MAKRRRLTDLYVTGKEVTVNDDSGEDPIVVYLQKLNPLENETALRKAGAARSRILAWGKNPDSEEFLSVQSEVWDIKDSSTLIEYLIQEDLSNRYASAEAELAEEDEWKKDGYFQGLRDAWEEGLAEKWAADPDEPEGKRVQEALKRFEEAVTKRVEQEADHLRSQWADVPEEELRDKVTDKFVKMRADMEWLREFRKCEVWLTTREPENHKKLYFTNRDEVDTIAPEVFQRLMSEYEALTVDVTEGKDLPETPDSSLSSDQSEKEGTEQSSGPVNANV